MSVKGYAHYPHRTKPYRVALSINGVFTYIGDYYTPEEAREAYEKAKINVTRTRRTAAPKPYKENIPIVHGSRGYCCHECELRFSVYWHSSNRQPYCPKCGDNAAVLLNPSKRRVNRAKTMPRWTDEQTNELINLYKTTELSYTEIGERIGKTKKAITHAVRRLRLEKKL